MEIDPMTGVTSSTPPSTSSQPSSPAASTTTTASSRRLQFQSSGTNSSQPYKPDRKRKDFSLKSILRAQTVPAAALSDIATGSFHGGQKLRQKRSVKFSLEDKKNEVCTWNGKKLRYLALDLDRRESLQPYPSLNALNGRSSSRSVNRQKTRHTRRVKLAPICHHCHGNEECRCSALAPSYHASASPWGYAENGQNEYNLKRWMNQRPTAQDMEHLQKSFFVHRWLQQNFRDVVEDSDTPLVEAAPSSTGESGVKGMTPFCATTPTNPDCQNRVAIPDPSAFLANPVSPPFSSSAARCKGSTTGSFTPSFSPVWSPAPSAGAGPNPLLHLATPNVDPLPRNNDASYNNTPACFYSPPTDTPPPSCFALPVTRNKRSAGSSFALPFEFASSDALPDNDPASRGNTANTPTAVVAAPSAISDVARSRCRKFSWISSNCAPRSSFASSDAAAPAAALPDDGDPEATRTSSRGRRCSKRGYGCLEEERPPWARDVSRCGAVGAVGAVSAAPDGASSLLNLTLDFKTLCLKAGGPGLLRQD